MVQTSRKHDELTYFLPASHGEPLMCVCWGGDQLTRYRPTMMRTSMHKSHVEY